jgi:hypothetical protein
VIGQLGKKPATEDHRDISLGLLKALAKDAGTPLPEPPTRPFGHGTVYSDGAWRMLGNGPDDTVEPGFDGAGCCVWSSAAHVSMEGAKVLGRRVEFTGRNVIGDYTAVTGYRIGEPATDQGTNMRDAMRYRQRVGVTDAAGKRHRIGAYVSIEPGNLAELAEAIWWFGFAEVGFVFTAAQYDQFDRGLWDYVPGSPDEGGHAVPLFGRTKIGLGAVSWADHVFMTPRLIQEQNDETWVAISEDHLRVGKTERGFDLAHLNAQLGLLR